MFQGRKRHVAMTAPKNGFFYMLDATNGQLLEAKPVATVNWATSIDLKTGKAVEVLDRPRGRGRINGGHNWWPMSYSPVTGLVYLPLHDPKPAPVPAGEFPELGKLVAWDPIRESVRWSVDEPISTNSGVLSTAGNLVFQGQGTGEFAAYSADTGQKVWSMETGSAIHSVPVSFALNGDQYILVPVGWGSGSRLFAKGSSMATPIAKRGPSRLLAFKLGAKEADAAGRLCEFRLCRSRRLKPLIRRPLRRAALFSRNISASIVTARRPTAAARSPKTAPFPICAICPPNRTGCGTRPCSAESIARTGCRASPIRPDFQSWLEK